MYSFINHIIDHISVYILNRSFIKYISLKLGLKKFCITYSGLVDLWCHIYYVQYFITWGLGGAMKEFSSTQSKVWRVQDLSSYSPGSSCTVLLDPHPHQIMVCHVSPNDWLFSTFCPHTNAFRYIHSKALADSDFFSFLPQVTKSPFLPLPKLYLYLTNR